MQRYIKRKLFVVSMAALVPPTPNKARSLSYAFPARNLLLAERVEDAFGSGGGVKRGLVQMTGLPLKPALTLQNNIRLIIASKHSHRTVRSRQ